MLNVSQLHLPQGVLRALYFARLVALWEVDTSRIHSAKLTYLLSFLFFVGRWVEVGQTYLDDSRLRTDEMQPVLSLFCPLSIGV